MFEELLQRPESADTRKALAAAVKSVASAASPAAALAECRAIAARVAVPAEVQDALRSALAGAGVPVPEAGEKWEAALSALRAVWASKYTDRAFTSTRKVGIGFDDVRMAVLVQVRLDAARVLALCVSGRVWEVTGGWDWPAGRPPASRAARCGRRGLGALHCPARSDTSLWELHRPL